MIPPLEARSDILMGRKIVIFMFIFRAGSVCGSIEPSDERPEALISNIQGDISPFFECFGDCFFLGQTACLGEAFRSWQ